MTTTIPILLYHSVTDRPTGDFGPFTVSRSQFASHLDRLLDQGFETLTIGQLLERIRARLALPERIAVITMDDGFADFEANAWPELQERGMNATLYVTAGVVGGRASWSRRFTRTSFRCSTDANLSILRPKVVRSALIA
jgi:peptidoglycan/xylan/chitin deacetylase (PgdA/CDA1 family)